MNSDKSFFETRGWCVLRDAFPVDLVRSFSEQVETELGSPSFCPESGTRGGLLLRDAGTWPGGSERRVVECVPVSVGPHWEALRGLDESVAACGEQDTEAHRGEDAGARRQGCVHGEPRSLLRLKSALDAILGPGRWVLPLNPSEAGGGRAVVLESRHWYVPCTFPEQDLAENRWRKSAASLEKLLGEAKRADAESCIGRRLRGRIASSATHSDCGTCEVGPRGSQKFRPWTAEEDEVLVVTLLHLTANADTALYTAPPWSKISQQLFVGKSKRAVRRRAVELHSRGKFCHRRGSPRLSRGIENAMLLFLTDQQIPQTNCQSPPLVKRRIVEDAPLSPGSSWFPVNRRRVPWRGWHLDIGANFSPSDLRTLWPGNEAQGLVLLVLLSDAGPGCGGTAMVSGSHRWVARELVRHGSVSHQILNEFAVAEFERRRKQGRVRLSRSGEGPPSYAPVLGDEEQERDIVVEQVVGKAGDIVLMHPLLLHCGTTNFGPRPRVMANGMVRIRPGRVSCLAEADLIWTTRHVGVSEIGPQTSSTSY